MSADINKVWWLHMHTFLLVCRITVLGWPHQRLSPPTYWFIRGDLEPRCHMLPQMGNFPQAIQAPWQQAWTIMDAKGEREKELCQPPGKHRLRVRPHMWIIDPLLCVSVRDFAWCALLYVQSHVCWRTPSGPGTPAAPAYSPHALTRRRVVDAGRCRREGGGPIRPPVTDSSMRHPVPSRPVPRPPPPEVKTLETGLLRRAEEKQRWKRVNYRQMRITGKEEEEEHLKYVATTFFTLLHFYMSFLQVFFLEFMWMCHGFTAVSFPDLDSLERD